MSKDVKPLTMADLKTLDAIAPGTEHVAKLRATVEALDEARADNAALVEALEKRSECGCIWSGYPKGTTCLDVRTKALEPTSNYAAKYRAEWAAGQHLCEGCEARHLLVSPHPGSALLERLKKLENCGAAEPVSGCDCNRCLIRNMQSAFLAQIAAEARVKELEEALREMTPAPGFPKCDSRCSSNRHSYDEDNRCDCGMDEIRHRAEAARAALSTPKVKP